MKIVFVPMYRLGVGYTVTVGRRWSILDRILLAELTKGGYSVRDLAVVSDLPDRIIVESLINLLRSNLIEVRAGAGGAVFAATAVGKRRAADGDLPQELRREIRWVSLCMDRLTGCWLRSDDLDLVPSHDLPENAYTATPLLTRLNYDDPDVRGLVHLRPDEDLEGFEPSLRQASSTFARIGVAYRAIAAGLPPTTPLRLRTAVLDEADGSLFHDDVPEWDQTNPPIDVMLSRDTIRADDVIVGGLQHLEVLRGCLAAAKSHVVIHSCFVSPDTVKKLLPDIEKAARRKVRVDCLWGLRDDPEALDKIRPVNETFSLVDALPAAIRKFVNFSRASSKSHAKVVIYDDSRTGRWVSIIGSCNFLSSVFDSVEISIRTRSQRLSAQLMSQLIAAQLPSSGAWSPIARRLNVAWNSIRRGLDENVEVGAHSIQMLADADHYSVVTTALDHAKADIVVGCDIYGEAAETSVLVTLAAAARDGIRTRIYYHRPSRYLEQEGRTPDPSELSKRGLDLVRIPELHGKFLCWDDSCVVVTSFNWLATVSKDARARGAELGLSIGGPGIRAILANKLCAISSGRLDIGVDTSVVAPESIVKF